MRFRQFAQLIQAYGVQTLENITVFTMQWRATVGLIKTQNVLEASDDAFFTRGSSECFERGNLYP
ncbi:hypothetical protein D3C80_2138260 [compost metagenome]